VVKEVKVGIWGFPEDLLRVQVCVRDHDPVLLKVLEIG